jgi:hypothetical protein
MGDRDWNITATFPQPYFFMFFPNQSAAINEANSVGGTHVEIRCLRPGDIQPGSQAPASVEDILNRKDFTFSALSATTASSSTTPTAVITSVSVSHTGGANAIMTVAPLLNAAAVVAGLLVV